jgi:hypothetical protein
VRGRVFYGIRTGVHGKGKKNGTVPLPETIMQEFNTQIEVVWRLHDQDLAVKYDGVFLDDAVEKKYPNAPKANAQALRAADLRRLDGSCRQRPALPGGKDGQATAPTAINDPSPTKVPPPFKGGGANGKILWECPRPPLFKAGRS